MPLVIIKAQNLIKKYKDILAVNNVNLEIEKDECFGLLGPNGAGKTTLIRMLIAASPPGSGSIEITGKDLRAHASEIKAVMGVVPQTDNLDNDLTAAQNLLVFARYFNIPRAEAKKRSVELLKLFGLESKSKSRVTELSGGMKRRLLVARGLINRPKILILDEPTVGLDPQARYLVWQELIQAKSHGVTQIISTQNMEEASRLCDRVAIMNQGSIVTVGTPRELTSQYVGQEVWEIDVDSRDKTAVLKEMKNLNLEFEDTGYKIYVFHSGNDENLHKMQRVLGQVAVRPATLEDVFFRLTGRSLAE